MNTTNTDDEKFIAQLLDESGVSASEPLQEALLKLRAENTGPVTAPSGELAALMAPNVTALRPRRKAAKAATVGIAVVAATGLGVSGVAAASPEFRDAASNAVQQVVHFFDSDAGKGSSDGSGQGPGPDKSTDRTSGDGGNSRSAPGSTAIPSPDEVASADPNEHAGSRSGRAPAKEVTVEAPDKVSEAPRPDSGSRSLDLPGHPGSPVTPGAPRGNDAREDQSVLVPKPIAPQPSDPPDIPAPVQVPPPVDDPTSIPPLPESKVP